MSLLRLYPSPQQEVPLKQLYLKQPLPMRNNAGNPFVYTNYITSLDGRIAVPHPTKPGLQVPSQIGNERDWRLFQELAVQADVIISSGRYLRDRAEGRAQEILNVYDDSRFADLGEWRLAQSLPRYPALAVVSGSLNFPVPDVLTRGERRLYIFTHAAADVEKRQKLESLGGNVRVWNAGKEAINAGIIIQILNEQGHNRIFNSTGPKVNHLLLSANVLDRLYLTFAHRLLGGDPFATVVEGVIFPQPKRFSLASAYLDLEALEGDGQLFLRYDLK